jgi:multiple antibiotic resistance protein
VSDISLLLIGSFTSIFTIVNPFGAIPAFLALTANHPVDYRLSQLKKATFFMFMVLTLFFLAGTYIMNFFSLSLEGMRIAGGIMLMQAAFSMLNPVTKGKKLSDEDIEDLKEKPEIAFSPLAMPLLSGPGSIAVVLGLSSSAKELMDYPIILLSIFIVAVFAYLILRVAPWFSKFLGPTGLTVMTRMMGFISLCIGIQFIINGIMPILKQI